MRVSETNAIIRLKRLPEINGDEGQLRQLFQNLIGNAIKYHKADVVPEVNVTCTIVEATSPVVDKQTEGKKGNHYLIEISDNGIDFEQKYSDKIFQVSQRLHGRSEYEGTGVGLAIVQKVVTNHKGHITAESEPGKGSRFKILLPS